jgi:hypothetical protein
MRGLCRADTGLLPILPILCPPWLLSLLVSAPRDGALPLLFAPCCLRCLPALVLLGKVGVSCSGHPEWDCMAAAAALEAPLVKVVAPGRKMRASTKPESRGTFSPPIMQYNPFVRSIPKSVFTYWRWAAIAAPACWP